MTFELIHKPTFTNQLFAIPKERMVQILEKIEILRDDPQPHGNLKKKLNGYKGSIYRLRSGDYRIIYTYGDRWVALLGVDDRKDIYKGDKLVAEPAALEVQNLPNMSDWLTPKPEFQFGSTIPTASPTPLPVQIDEDLLKHLLISPEYFSSLLACRTLDDLIEAKIPDGVRNRIFDCVTSPNFDLILQQPNLMTGSTDNLLRFKEGDLLGFLLKLNPEQEKYVTWSLNASGPTLLKGGPGTGKSTVALFRVRAILEALRATGTQTPKILFTTYTNALVTFSEQLLVNLLGDDIQYVDVKTADSLAYSLIRQASGKPILADSTQLRQILKQALPAAIDSLAGNKLQRHAQAQILQRLGLNYLLEEIDVIEAREVTTLEEYQATSRSGRQVSLNNLQRQAVWHLREHFYQLLAQQGLETRPQLRSRAHTILQAMEHPPYYDAVIIDEAQDLDPNALRLLIRLCRAPNRLFITADANQSIYGGSFRWRDVHGDLKFVGRTGILRTNHRTTREINEAAHAYLADGVIDAEPVDQDYVSTGPPPAVRSVTQAAEETALLEHFCRTAAREFRLGIGACALLVPTEKAGRSLAQLLQYQGLEAQFMSSKKLDLNWPGIKILTLKAAKGLEFPVVAIAGFLDAPFPTIPPGTPEAAEAEIYSRERRTLFVGMTRAMRALLVVVPAQNPNPLLQNFDPQLWNL